MRQDEKIDLGQEIRVVLSGKHPLTFAICLTMSVLFISGPALINAHDVFVGEKIGAGTVDLAALQAILVIAMAAVPILFAMAKNWATKFVLFAGGSALFLVNLSNTIIAASHYPTSAHDGALLVLLLGISESAARDYHQIMEALAAQMMALFGPWSLVLFVLTQRFEFEKARQNLSARKQ